MTKVNCLGIRGFGFDTSACIGAAAIVLGLLSAASTSAVETSNATLAQSSVKVADDASEISDESLQSAEALVRDYLPELRPVMTALKKHSAAEYSKAVNDLARTSRRLTLLQGRDLEAFELEVALVQWQTRADLALAKLQVRDDKSTRAQLKDALRNREDMRLQRAIHERQRVKERMARIKSQWERLDAQINQTDIDAAVDKAYSALTRKLPSEKDPTTRNRRKPTKTSESK